MSMFTPTKNPALLLKSMPPRIARGFCARTRLEFDYENQIYALSAPTGYGKTSQLSEWRRHALSKGFLTFWYSVDEFDDPFRFILGLTRSAQSACGELGFNSGFSDWIEECSNINEAISAWLAEAASLSVNIILLLDDIDLLPTESGEELLPYLMGNLPPNLYIAMASKDQRVVAKLGSNMPGAITRFTTSDLRFKFDETISILSSLIDQKCTPDIGVHVHKLTEGWPMGVKLAGASLKRGDNIQLLSDNALADLQGYFSETVLNRLPAEQVNKLVCLSQMDLIHPNLCQDVLNFDIAGKDFRQLQEEVPILLSVEGDSEWSRLHPMAKNLLLKRLELTPLSERKSTSLQAAQWYSQHGHYEEASKQFLLAGEVDKAIDLIQNSTQKMTVQGRSSAVLAWFERMSPEVQLQHPRFWWPAAWALAMSSRHAEALPLVDLLLTQPNLTEAEKFDTDLILSAVAGFADKIALIDKTLEQWKPPFPSNIRSGDSHIYAIGMAQVALHSGDPNLARSFLTQVNNNTVDTLPILYNTFGVGQSYIWEGRFNDAENILKPALQVGNRNLDRNHPATSSIAALLAHASWQLGDNESSKVFLAGRLDEFEHYCLPGATLSAYKTLSRVADAEGNQDIALSLLDSLAGIGKRRSLLRLEVLASFELVRLHSRHKRLAMAKESFEQLSMQIASNSEPDGFSRWLELHGKLAQTYLLIAEDNFLPSDEELECALKAKSLALSLARNSDAIEAQLMYAKLLNRRGDSTAASIRIEALSLAKAANMVRILSENEPLSGPTNLTTKDSKPAATTAVKNTVQLDISSSALLTPKECEVLAFLNDNFSNKEIARAMDISVETVKWHLKNLFGKLNAVSRKHVVARAKMIGLIEST